MKKDIVFGYVTKMNPPSDRVTIARGFEDAVRLAGVHGSKVYQAVVTWEEFVPARGISIQGGKVTMLPRKAFP